MVVNGRPLKRARTKGDAGEMRDFWGFPLAGDEGLVGPFRAAVRAFLARNARLLPLPSIFSPTAAAAPPYLLTWRIGLAVGDGDEVVELNVVEEDVLRSRSVYCDQCRVVGWSGHPVCGKRYHFIIENDSNQTTGCRQSCCLRCGTVMQASESRCLLCNFEMVGEEMEECGYLHLEETSHLLHAVVHANGYGHLLRVNGHEGGSKHLTGRDIMNFWDRLCKVLHIRKVTVMDISKKYGMEYRLLHAVTGGHPWYGEWGYQFGAGCYALTANSYKEAVATLSGVPLTLFFSHRDSKRTHLENVIAFYWSLSDQQLVTVRDLFVFIMQLLREAHKNSRITKPAREQQKEAFSKILSVWTREDVELVESAMIKVLRAVSGRWVSWRALKGATSKVVESPELLDYSLRGLGGKLTNDGLVVAVRCNTDASAIEFRLEDPSNQPPVECAPVGPSAEHLLHDLQFLFDALLNPVTMQNSQPQVVRAAILSAAATILDCKQFIKHYDDPLYKAVPSNPFVLCVRCSVELVDHPKDYTAPPPEIVFVPASATVADLKLQASRAFQETYLMFQTFQAEQLLDFPNVSNTAPLKLILGSTELVRVRGRCTGDHRRLGQFRMERGLENWIVDCTCGAKDDDGERMLACDFCGVWQHTRCLGISDFEEVPAKFVCKKCVSPRKGKGRAGGGGRMEVNSSGRCKDEMESSIGVAGKLGRLGTVG